MELQLLKTLLYALVTLGILVGGYCILSRSDTPTDAVISGIRSTEATACVNPRGSSLEASSSFIPRESKRFYDFKNMTGHIARDMIENVKWESDDARELANTYKDDVLDIWLLHTFNRSVLSMNDAPINEAEAIQVALGASDPSFYTHDILSLSGARLTRIPHEALRLFENLTVLFLEDNGLTKGIEDLSGMPRLKKLYLRGNNLSKFPDFSQFGALIYLDLGDNVNLSHATADDIKLCDSLKQISLRNTGLSEDVIAELRERYPAIPIYSHPLP